MPMLAIITLPANASTAMLADAGVLFTDLFPIIALAVGVPLAFYVIKQVISLVPKSRGRRQ